MPNIFEVPTSKQQFFFIVLLLIVIKINSEKNIR